MAEESVRVAVRVRPFNKREKEANAQLCVKMEGNSTICIDPKSGEEKKFAYDFSYWSFDNFHEDANGYNTPDNSKYTDQKKVYADLGQGVLANAWDGFNASLFAYGQTGSGKSYSVVGYGCNKGIVPLVCEDIFKTSSTITDKTIEVYFSMLEIYSEVVRDLLVTGASRKGGLQIRQDAKLGFYPVGLEKKMVTDYSQIEKLTDEGTANRTIASTNMNATSSRAHTIVTVTLIQKYKNEAGKEFAKTSVINLVDLAGSERADATGATGDRLKEGAAINLSLTALGNVISALADQSNGKKDVRVPYRDSSLTKLLMNALGGNSKTIMIAAISPADINFDESVSTLRYADRAKQIKTKAVVNEDPTEKLIRDLKEENEKLKAMLKSGKIDPSMLSDNSTDQKSNQDDARLQLEAMKKALEENEREEEELKKSYEEKLAAAKLNQSNSGNERAELLEKLKTTPHFANLNMDPTLSRTVFKLLEGKGCKTIGKPGSSDIPVSGLVIGDPHAKITISEDVKTFTLEACSSECRVLRNGSRVTEPVNINHLDRIVFGSTQFYLFINPLCVTNKDVDWTFEMAQDEIGKQSGVIPKSEDAKLSQDQIISQSELVELLPHIEEANNISIALDKKVKYTAYPVPAAIRGEYDNKVKILVSVKNFALGLNWLWTKEKFMDRKLDMSEYYLDIKEDGKVDQNKFKNYDPFAESPDTPTQIGTANISLISLGHMMPIKESIQILDMKSKKAGKLDIEVFPCDASGKPIKDQIVRNPAVDMKNKPISFVFKLDKTTDLNSIFEDCYCQFTVPSKNKMEIIKSPIIKGSNPNFKFTKQFDLTVDTDFLDFILNKQVFIQVWGEQKHPSPDLAVSKMTTREYFDKEAENAQTNMSGKMREKSTDPELQKLKDKIKFLEEKSKKDEETIAALKKLLENHRDGNELIEDDWMMVLQKYGWSSINSASNGKKSPSMKSENGSSTCTLL